MSKAKPAAVPAPQVLARDDIHLAVTRCPFCRTDVEHDADQAVCRSCLTRHHAACWDEAHACSACSCAESLQASEPAARSRLVPFTLLGLTGALVGTAPGVTHNDALFVLLPLVACAIGGAMLRSYRSVWQPPLMFLASFLATFGLWIQAGNLQAHGFHPLNYSVLVVALGTLAAALGTLAARRLRPKA